MIVAAAAVDSQDIQDPTPKTSLTSDLALGGLRTGTLPWNPAPIGQFRIFFSDNSSVDDLFILLK